MHFFIDLRYLFPPFVNLCLYLFLTSKGDGSYYYWGQNDVVDFLQYPILIFLILAILLLLFLLFTSIKLPLTAKPLRLRAGNFSALLAAAFLASIMLPPSLFWFAYLLLVIISPWYRILWSLFKHLFDGLCQNLRSIPTIFINCVTQNQENFSDPAATRIEQIIGRVVDTEDNLIQQNRSRLEQDLVVVIDG
ncbi:hypothetical protein EZV62_023769 [Acer yangbiense]|uniref:Uncharacterized protein n=1 Tax=Acer yangbiense TaxID=1000413 RepID=A0A5C7H3G4_9ROSI|nr:hypothetical protein EZV62_023769 [Acer yangbiense]